MTDPPTTLDIESKEPTPNERAERALWLAPGTVRTIGEEPNVPEEPSAHTVPKSVRDRCYEMRSLDCYHAAHREWTVVVAPVGALIKTDLAAARLCPICWEATSVEPPDEVRAGWRIERYATETPTDGILLSEARHLLGLSRAELISRFPAPGVRPMESLLEDWECGRERPDYREAAQLRKLGRKLALPYLPDPEDVSRNHPEAPND